MKKLGSIGLLFFMLFQISCKQTTNTNSLQLKSVENRADTEKVFKHIYGMQTNVMDSIINFAEINPDTNYPVVVILLDKIFCNACKAEAAVFLNELFPKIKGLPNDNVLLLTGNFRRKEVPLFKKEDYPLNNWDTLHLKMSNHWSRVLKEKYDIIGSSLLVFDTKGNIVYTKQFKSPGSNVDSVANIITGKNLN
jgi:hypothetical protein